MALQSYRDLGVWQKAMDLVVAVYGLSALLPSDEKYGLSSRLQRAAVSVPANIAEGYGRIHRGDYLRHLSFARGFMAELETLVGITVRLSLVAREQVKDLWALSQEVGKMLGELIRKLEAKQDQAADPRP